MATINMPQLDTDDVHAIFMKQISKVTIRSLYGYDPRDQFLPSRGIL